MKRIVVAIFAVLFFIPVSVFAADDLTAVSYMTYDTTYDAIIKMYIRVMNAGGDDGHRHDLYNDHAKDYLPTELSQDQLYTQMKKTVGYRICDLNGDGIEELIIGLDSTQVLEVFTMDNGKVRELMRGIARNNIAIMTNGRFYRYNNSGGGSASSTIWRMNGTAPVSYIEGYFRNDDFGSYSDDSGFHYYDYQWFKLQDPNKRESSSENKVTANEYLTWLKEQDSQLLKLSFIPLSIAEQGIDSDHVGVIAVNGKTNGRDTVNIRSKASRKSKIVKVAKTGTYVEILEEEEDFYRIKIAGKEGYIQKDFLMISDSAGTEQKMSIYSSESTEYQRENASEEHVIPAKPLVHGLIPLPVNDRRTSNNTSSTSGKDQNITEQPIQITETDSIEVEYVIDHYETREVQKSHQVMDHYETYFTYTDNGDGTFTEVPHERPVYRTEYYTETIQEPVYVTFRKN